jgi:hypothetical protein
MLLIMHKENGNFIPEGYNHSLNDVELLDDLIKTKSGKSLNDGKRVIFEV